MKEEDIIYQALKECRRFPVLLDDSNKTQSNYFDKIEEMFK